MGILISLGGFLPTEILSVFIFNISIGSLPAIIAVASAQAKRYNTLEIKLVIPTL